MFDFLSQKLSSLLVPLRSAGKMTEQNIAHACDTIRQALIEADVAHDLASSFVHSVKQEAIGRNIQGNLKPGQQFFALVHQKMVEFMGGDAQQELKIQAPSIIMVCGLQGSGKTTTVAKLARLLVKQASQENKKRSVLLSSVDFYRPAAIDQLAQLAKQVGVDWYQSSHTTDPRMAAQEVYEHFKKEKYDILILDTAGRLHVDAKLMSELQAITACLKPRYRFLVLDSMTGQESLSVARAFDTAIGVDGAILTKVDSDTRGGAAFAFSHAVGKPIYFMGTGEKLDDLSPFHVKRVISRMIGLGDLESLADKASEQLSQRQVTANYKSLVSGKMTLLDFADQIAMIDKLGSLSQMSKYMPSFGVPTVSQKNLEQGQQELKLFKAIISSMTMKERISPQILDGSRKKRIAKGAGVPVGSVNLLLQRFEQLQQSAKLFKKLGFFG